MKTVKIKSYAKINLTLQIEGIENGYHLLDSLTASIDLYDYLVIKKKKGCLSSITMKGMGSESIPPEKNNALKAAEAFSKRFQTEGADVTVYKNIPIGAGLGGSSADVVGVINGMAKLYGVTDRAALKALADELGSDTGYMLNGGFARMRGRGELVEELPIKTKLHFLLLCPSSSVSAKECYHRYDELPHTLALRPNFTEECIRALLSEDKNEVGRYLMNDLYPSAIALNRDVEKAQNEAASFSPLGTVMTGSGSGVVALFETKELCDWAKSRYKGKCRAYTVSTVTPDYVGKAKSAWRNPYALTDEENELLQREE